jgi:hypothetical protein
MDMWKLECAGKINKMLSSSWLQKHRSFDKITLNEGMQRVYFFPVEITVKAQRICGLRIGLGQVFQTLLVSKYLTYKQSLRVTVRVPESDWLQWNCRIEREFKMMEVAELVVHELFLNQY